MTQYAEPPPVVEVKRRVVRILCRLAGSVGFGCVLTYFCHVGGLDLTKTVLIFFCAASLVGRELRD